MTDKKDPSRTIAVAEPDLVRRRLLKHALWVAPAIVGTAAVRARAAGSCNPDKFGPCPPED